MLRKLSAFKISSLPKFAQFLPYPFECTINPQQFKFIDQRFQQYPVVQKLFPNQHEHLKYVLTLFQKLLNKGVLQSTSHQFIDKRLIHKSLQFREVLKQLQTQIQFNINKQKCNQSVGYLQYFGLKPEFFIHNYIIDRNDEKIRVIQREQLKKISEKTAEQQLKEDINELQKSNSAMQKLKGKESKTKKAFDQFFFGVLNTVNKTYQNSINAKKFQPYFLTNKLKTYMDIKINSPENGENRQENIQVITKWYYEITSQEPESVRNSRKRVLFDFQLWNRGCLIPVQNFSLNQHNK